MAAVAGRDGTNTGISMASTPINRKKVIPNTRRGSNKSKCCNLCGGELTDTGETISKDEFDVIIDVVKRRHEYHIYRCADCGGEVRIQIIPKLKEANQYGSNIQAAALSLMVTGNVAINKVRMLINGMTSGQMNPSEGFICKLYKKASLGLAVFMKDLKKLMIQRALVYWDDTVIIIQTCRACMRFYGDETFSYYSAHDRKDLTGLLEDNILPLLTKETTVMHNHNKVNYNELFCFQNIECNQHLERDLQKVSDDNPEHTWSTKMKSLISLTIKERKDFIAENVSEFQEEHIIKFKKEMSELIKKGYKESSISTNPTTVPSENTLLARIEKYFENYFKWVEDFKLPTTDNLSEHGLRSIKSHMKMSGQFENVQTYQE